MNRLIRWMMMTLCLVAAPLLAQTATQGQTTPDVTAPAADLDETNPNAIMLTLDEAIGKAVESNLGVKLDYIDYGRAGYNAKAAYGPFDWYTSATLSRSSSKQPAQTTVEGSQADRTVANFGLQQLLSTGGTYQIGFNNDKLGTNNPVSLFNPTYGSDLSFNLTQPLLRNFGVDITRRGIRIARNNLGISEEGFRNSLTQTVLGVEQAYWDLIFTRKNLAVKQQSLGLATDQERITQIRIDVGASAPLDILQPRVAIATREEEVISARAQVRDVEDRLRQLMNLDRSQWDSPLIPTESIEYRAVDIQLDEAVTTAMELRPEVRQAELGVDSQKIQYLYARNQILPRVDFNASYGQAGLSGTVRDETTGQVISKGSFSDAIDNTLNGNFDSWSFGFTVGVPITNVQARAQAKEAQLAFDRSSVNTDRLKQNVLVDVRTAARSVETLKLQIAATSAARDAAEQNLQAERKRFENGMTTNFQVLQIQQDLSDAQSREIAALVAYRKALADFHRAVGDLLQTHEITLKEPAQFSLSSSAFERVRWLNYGNYVGTK